MNFQGRKMQGRYKRLLPVMMCAVALWAAQAAQSQMVTAGQFSVTPSGAATYSIPIQLPAGVAGMEPKLALSYSNQGGNGLLGVGWVLSGLSSISRCPQTKLQDGAAALAGVHFNSTDRYCLDGQRLNIVGAGSYGADGVEYRTEMDGFSKITSYSETGATGGPGSFIVKTKAGLTMEYGKTTDSRIEATGSTIVVAWALNKVTDAKGNYYTVSYGEDNPNGQFYPNKISYTGTAAGAGSQSVQFFYENRNDVILTYMGGFPARMSVRLNRVKIFSDLTLLKDYSLSYSYSLANARSVLSGVTECAGNGACLPTVNIGAQGGAQQFLGMLSSPGITGNFITSSSNSNNDAGSFVDLNGDGIVDYAVVWSSGGTRAIAVYLGKPDGTFSNLINTYVGGTFLRRDSDSNQDVGSFADVNGDGIQDYVVAWNNGGQRTISTYLGRGDGTFNTYVNTAVGGNFIPISLGSNAEAGSLMDVNGDGLADYVIVWSNGGARSFATYLAKGDGTFNGGIYTTVDGNFISTSSGVIQDVGSFHDVDGDGYPDYVVVWNDGAHRNVATYKGMGDGRFANLINSTLDGMFVAIKSGSNQDIGEFVDVNGDGLTDYAVVWNNGGNRAIGVYFAKGDGTFSNTISTSENEQFAPTYQGYNQDAGSFYDVNGDGVADYVVPWGVGGSRNIGVYFGHPDGTFSGPTNSAVGGGFGQIAAGSNLDIGVVADANGDGLPDYVVVWNNGGTRAIVTYFNQGPFPDFVRTISNGVQGSTTITYASMSAGTNYQKGMGAAYPVVELKTPAKTVSQVSVSNGVGGLTTTNYSYGVSRAQIGTLGRGFLGFQWMQSQDAATGLTSRTCYRQDWPYIGLVDKAMTATSSAGLPACNAFGGYNDLSLVTPNATSNLLSLTLNAYKFNAYLSSDTAYTSPVTCADDPSTGKTSTSCPASATTAGNRYQAYAFQSLTQSRDWDGTTFIALPATRTTMTQDNLGNATQVKAETLNADGTTFSGYSKTTTNTYMAPDMSNWLLGRLQKSSVQAVSP